MIDGSEYIRRELMIRLVRAFDSGKLEAEIDQIPVRLRPKDGPSSRCCVYHDRAVFRYLLMNLMGFASEEEADETRRLADYAKDALARKPDGAEKPPLSVCTASCSGCPPARLIVTGNCRGCFARPCLYNCPKGAISIVDQTSTIDYAKCVKCGKCQQVCPFHAIVKTTVPCEDACPVGAIRKGEDGRAHIDFAKCVFCGKCFAACPFGAVMERSQMLDVLAALARGEKIVAMVAPSATAQFPGTIEQLFTAISKLGFADVVEVAIGAELTTWNEAGEFKERIGKGAKLMTTSCCPAYVELVRKHAPEFLPNVSSTPSPMVYTAQFVHKKHPDAKTVFIGPCVAKRAEAARKGIDYVLSFEETGAVLAGRKIDVIACAPWPIARPAIATARNFAHSCGVTKAVLTDLDMPKNFKLDAKFIDGIDKRTCAMLKLYGAGKLPANFLEVMACHGGCVSGPTSLAK